MPTRVETLDNGLKVILRPIPDTKALSTWVVYRIGSRNEVPRMNGSTPWVEHMLFNGGGQLAQGDTNKMESPLGGQEQHFHRQDFTMSLRKMPPGGRYTSPTI